MGAIVEYGLGPAKRFTGEDPDGIRMALEGISEALSEGYQFGMLGDWFDLNGVPEGVFVLRFARNVFRATIFRKSGRSMEILAKQEPGPNIWRVLDIEVFTISML